MTLFNERRQCNVKCVPSCKVPIARLISLIPISYRPTSTRHPDSLLILALHKYVLAYLLTFLHCETTDTGPVAYSPVHRAVYFFTPHVSLVLSAPAHGGMARLG